MLRGSWRIWRVLGTDLRLGTPWIQRYFTHSVLFSCDVWAITDQFCRWQLDSMIAAYSRALKWKERLKNSFSSTGEAEAMRKNTLIACQSLSSWCCVAWFWSRSGRWLWPLTTCPPVRLNYLFYHSSGPDYNCQLQVSKPLLATDTFWLFYSLKHLCTSVQSCFTILFLCSPSGLRLFWF